MNEAHLHVALNHFPVVGAVIAAVMLCTGLWRKNMHTQETALWLLVFIALLAIPVLLTGESAKEMVEHLPGVDEGRIKRHEKLAKISVGLLIAAGIASAAGLYLLRLRKRPAKFILLVTVLAVIGAVSAGLTANTGGRIRHSEFENAAIEDNEELKPSEKDGPGNKTGEPRGRKRKGRDH